MSYGSWNGPEAREMLDRHWIVGRFLAGFCWCVCLAYLGRLGVVFWGDCW